MADMKGLKRELNEWFDRDPVGAGVRFVSRSAWRDRGEHHGRSAALTLIIEGTALYNALNYGEPSWSYMEQLNAIACRHGYWWELGYAWSVHFYKLDRAKIDV